MTAPRPTFRHYVPRIPQSDSDALRGDWEAVGKDLRIAMGQEPADPDANDPIAHLRAIRGLVWGLLIMAAPVGLVALVILVYVAVRVFGG